MKTVKLLILLLLITLLLPLPGLARGRYYSISEVREQASQAWQQTYTAHGREIAVDVLPHVPDVEAVPILQLRLARLNLHQDPQGRWEATGRPEDFIFAIDADREAVTETRGFVQSGVLYKNFDLNKCYIQSNPQTLGDMLQMIRNLMETSGLNADMLYLERPHSIRRCIYQDKDGNQDAEPALMDIELYQSIRGFPVAGMHSRAYFQNRNGRNAPSLTDEPHIDALILSPAQFALSLYRLMEEADQLAEDVPLASFQQVVKTLEKEIKDGRLRKVFNLIFGYAIYADAGNQKPVAQADNLFYAVPVWAVDCIYVENAKQKIRDYSAPEWEGLTKDPYNVLEYMRLMVDAQTGKLVDPHNQKENREQFKGFLSWDDVGGK